MPYNVAFLNDAARRPVDELIRRAFRRDGVCKGILKEVLDCSGDLVIPDKIDWMDGHLQPRLRTWNTDLIGKLDDQNLIHIEQQTTGHSDMDIRMLEYGSLIAANDGLIRNVNQFYLSTDDRPIRGRINLDLVDNKKRSIRNRFIFIDAGEGDPWAFFQHRDFDVALFGLLSRDMDDERRFIRAIVQRALSDFDDQERDLIDRLVDCVGMGALRRRGRLVQEFIPMQLRELVDQDPYIAEMQDKKERQFIRTLLDRAIAKSPFMPSNDFIAWLARHENVALVQDAALEIATAATFDDMIAALGIKWPLPEQDQLPENVPAVPGIG
ncbi:MAG: hypothetical protein KL863_16075 [Rhizobium sp.]|nr:hypothetical protein [Rhizobium sp.]